MEGGNNSTATSYAALDVFKFVLAFFVVAIHTAPFSSVDPTLSYFVNGCLTRLAVPFYFIVSGFLCFRKTDPERFDPRRPLRTAYKCFRLYCLWTLIYLPLILETVWKQEHSLAYKAAQLASRFVFSGSYLHLWYLNATVFSLLLVSFLLSRKRRASQIVAAGFFFYLIGLLGQGYSALLQPLRNVPRVWDLLMLTRRLIIGTRSGLFMGFLFVGLGLYQAWRPARLGRKRTGALFLAFLLLLIGEAFALRALGWTYSQDMYLFLAPAAFLLFLLALGIPVPESWDTGRLRSCSTLIYLDHLWVSSLLSRIVRRLFGETFFTEHSLLRYVLVCVFAWALARLILRLSESERLRWLKKLYS